MEAKSCELLATRQSSGTRAQSSPMAKILTIHGPNLNLLGTREPLEYGDSTLDKINQELFLHGKQLGHEVICFQSNNEGLLIDRIQQSLDEGIDYIIINPAAYTHTSIALRDALLAVAIPFIEVHLSNIYKRESFRHLSYFSDIAVGMIAGFGSKGYLLALDAINHYLSKNGAP